MAQRNRLLLAFLTLPLVASCAGILGIEQAELETTSTGGSGTGGGASTGGGTSTGGAGTDGGGGGEKLLCADYCAAVKKNCSGTFELYTSLELCLAVCSKLPPGARGDTLGNTVGCRLHYANEIDLVGEKETNCPAAGPGGNGICGENCEGFCSITQGACINKNATYDSVEACKVACRTVPDLGGYSDSIDSGNSQQCRLYHASAATVDPLFHCPHTDIPGGPCSAPTTPAPSATAATP